MNVVTLTLPDGSQRPVAAGTSIADLAAAISPRLATSALAGWVNGRLVDLSCPIEEDATVRIITPDDPEALDLYRHIDGSIWFGVSVFLCLSRRGVQRRLRRSERSRATLIVAARIVGINLHDPYSAETGKHERDSREELH